MKVLIYSHGFPNPLEPYRNDFVRHIIRFLPADIDVKVVAPVPFFLHLKKGKAKEAVPGVRTDLIGERNVSVFHPRYPLLPRNYLHRIMGWLEAVFSLPLMKRIKRQWQPDLIHVNWAYPDGVAVNYLSKWLGIPYVVTEHQGSIADLLAKEHLKRLISRCYNRSKALIIVSPSLREPLKEVIGGLPQHQIVGNAIDTQLYCLKEKSPKPGKLVYIGNFYQGKGVRFLLEALAILRDQDIRLSLDLIGGGVLEAELQELCASLKLQDSVHFRGFIPPHEIPQALLNYDFLVLPSLAESFGMVLIEALACGLPVVSTYSGGPAHIITDETGVLAAPGDARALAAAIQQLVSTWDKYEPRKIRQHCIEHYDLRQKAPQLAEIYRRAIDKQDK